MKINHATFTDALQIAMSIEGNKDWREQLLKLALPKGWSIAVSVESTVIFDVGFVDPWTTAGVRAGHQPGARRACPGIGLAPAWSLD